MQSPRAIDVESLGFHEHTQIEVTDEELPEQWQHFEKEIATLINAHTDCRELNNIMDRCLRVSAMACSFVTTTLITLRESSESEVNVSPAHKIAECVMSSVVTLFAGLINMYDNAGQRQKHQNHVDKFRSLREKIKLARQHPRRSSQRSLYEKLKKRKIKIQSTGLSLFGHIRARHRVE
jgi:hypothetical protein